MQIIGLIARAAALLAILPLAACSSGSHSKKQVEGVQARAVEASAQLKSYAVSATGRVEQQGKSADLRLSYSAINPFRRQYSSASTFEGTDAETGLIVISADAWELDSKRWRHIDFGPVQAAASTFGAERMWNLVPFDQATLMGTESINGAKADHYRRTLDITLPLAELVGSLLPSDEPELTGDLRQVDLDFWVDAQNGWPVRVSYRGTGDATFGLTANLDKANDGSISIEPPP